MTTPATPARVQFQRFTATGDEPVIGQPGSLAINFTDRKVFTFDENGGPILISQRPSAFSTTRIYKAGDVIIRGDAFWKANVNTGPGAFNEGNWIRLAATEDSVPVEPYASGVLSGGVITALGGDSIEVAAGTGIVMDTSNPTAILETRLDWETQSFAASANGEVMRAVTLTAGGNMGTVSMDALDTARRDRIVVGYLIYDDGGVITEVLNVPRTPGQVAGDFADFMAALGGPFRVEGGVLSPHGTGTMGIQIETGTVFALDWRRRSAPAMPNFVTIGAQTPASFDVIRSDGEVVTADTNVLPDAVYDEGAVPVGFASIMYLFATPSGGSLYLQLGQTLYESVRDAAQALSADWEGYTPAFGRRNPTTLLMGALVVLRGASDSSDEDQVRIFNTQPGPAISAGFKFSADVQGAAYVRIDGSSQMEGNLDMGGNSIENAIIDAGVF